MASSRVGPGPLQGGARGPHRRRRRRLLLVRIAVLVAIAALGAVLVIAACGSEAANAPVPLPDSGRAYRALGFAQRLAVAKSCRDRAAARARGAAVRQLRAVDPAALRDQLDDAFTFFAAQRRPVAEVCAQRLPFVTPGLRLRFAGARRDGAGRFTYETTSDRPLTIRGQVAPAPRTGHVVARRETGPRSRFTTGIDAGGRFVISRIRLRKIADNTFTLTITAPPSAVRKIHFSAICLDCLAGGAPPPTQQ